MSELRYLRDLSSEELKALYKKNNGFSSEVYQTAIDNQGFLLSMVFEDVFGKSPEGFHWHDHYGTFFFELGDVEELCKMLDERERGVLDAALEQKVDALLAERDAWENLVPEETDDGMLDKKYKEFEAHGREVLREIEDFFHKIERDINIDGVLDDIRSGALEMSGWQTDGKVVVYQTTTALR